jgi:hypothetical protein
MSTLALRQLVAEIVQKTPVFDIHTHLYDPAFGDLLLWGIDDLLTYHYLVAESLRWLDLPYDHFWSASKTQQADAIWDALFVQHSPISEACRGVITVLNQLGLDVAKRDLPALRRWFAEQKPSLHVDRICGLANVRKIAMTNSPFDDIERPLWDQGFPRDPRFVAALRIDQILVDWPYAARRLVEWGYQVREDIGGDTCGEVRRFLADWTKKIGAQYFMVSLPPNFNFPENSGQTRLIEHALMPHGRDHNQAFAMMIGVRRGANPALRMAGDSVAAADVTAVERLCAAFPANKFLCTMLARENQHALCVAARKFRNLHIFGCWWFLNVPSLIEETTRMRLELLGLSCTPQHSDCRVLDQLAYKWSHTRPILAKVLAEKYEDLATAGWPVYRADIERDVQALLGGAFERFIG